MKPAPVVLLAFLAGCQGAPPPDPLAAQPDVSAGLTDTSPDLSAVLENGALPGACDRYRTGPAGDRKAMLLCGKSMFFYESFGTAGVPAVLAQFLVDNFPDEIGPGFEKLGMVADPSSPQHLPLGLSPTAKLGGQIDALAFTCASCHFTQLSDGRYAVGAPNHRYDYGRQVLAMAMLPTVALFGAQNGQHDPQAVAAVQPLLDRLNADPALKTKLVNALVPLATGGAAMPMFPKEAEHHYATWRTGTMDFLIEPLPINDKVHTVSKISALWGIPGPDDLQHAKLTDAWLGWTGGASSMLAFAEGFVTIGSGPSADWPDDKLQPLVEYVLSLRTPANPSPPPAAEVARGRQLFADKGCLGCHSGPRGMGTRLYDYDEIGTDAQMKRWMGPDLTNTPCCNLPAGAPVVLTHQLKSPRLNGAWTMSRFLHNGSVSSLADLFCLNGPRGTVTEAAFSDGGHLFTCTNLSTDDKTALIAYLSAS